MILVTFLSKTVAVHASGGGVVVAVNLVQSQDFKRSYPFIFNKLFNCNRPLSS